MRTIQQQWNDLKEYYHEEKGWPEGEGDRRARIFQNGMTKWDESVTWDSFYDLDIPYFVGAETKEENETRLAAPEVANRQFLAYLKSMRQHWGLKENTDE
jgi:hypothetical protein